MTRLDTPAYTARVRARSLLTPHMARISLHDVQADDGSDRFLAPHPADGFFGLWVPGTDSDSDSQDATVKRYYSVRRACPRDRTLDVDVVLHGHGPGSSWGQNARPGDRVAFDEPRGTYTPPATATRILLFGDITALPAIARILDEHDDDAGIDVRAVIAVDDARDRQDLGSRTRDAVDWIAPDALVDTVLHRVPTAYGDDTYVWFSGEASRMRAVRHRLRHELTVPTHRWMTMAYWRRDSARWIERLLAEGPELRQQLDAIYDSDDEPAAQTDRAEALLAERGLL